MSILTSYLQFTVMCVLHHNLLCFSTAILLPFAVDFDELIFLLFDCLSRTVSIAPFFNNTFPLSRILLACCMAGKSNLQNAGCTKCNDGHLQPLICLLFFLLDLDTSVFIAGDLKKSHINTAQLYKLDYSQLSLVIDQTIAKPHTAASFVHALSHKCIKYMSSCFPVYVTRKATPTQEGF